MPSSEKSVQLTALTGIRFFAALYVVVYHFAAAALAKTLAPMAGVLFAGYTAVGFFFLLSGFVLSYSYIGKNGKPSVTRRSFWVARFARIYPAYLLAFLIAAPFQILGSLRVNGIHLALQKLTVGGALHLALLQAWSPRTVWYWNIPAWSLSVEAFFYLCFPFLAVLLGRMSIRLCWAVLLPLLCVALTAPSVYCLFPHVATGSPISLLKVAIETNPILRLPEFLIGIVLGRLYFSGFRFSAAVSSAVSVFALAGALILVSFSQSIPRPLLANGLLAPFSGLLILALAQSEGWLAMFLSWRPLKILGEASYGIYILQMPLASVLAVSPEHFTAARFALYVLVLIAVSILSLFFIEQPLRNQIKRMNASRTGRSGAPVTTACEQIGARA